MKNHFLKIAFVAVATIVTYSMSNLNSAQAINNVSEFFLTDQTTKISVKIEPNSVINDVIQPNSKATNEEIAVTQIINKLPEKSNWKYKFLHNNSQIKLVKSKVENWQYNLHQENFQLPIDPGIVLGVGLISVSRLFAKKRL